MTIQLSKITTKDLATLAMRIIKSSREGKYVLKFWKMYIKNMTWYISKKHIAVKETKFQQYTKNVAEFIQI